MTLQVTSNNVYSAQGVAISVTAIAQAWHYEKLELSIPRRN